MMSLGIVYFNNCEDTRVAIYIVVQGAFCSFNALLFLTCFTCKCEAAEYPVVITPLIYLFNIVWGCIGVYWASYFCKDTTLVSIACVFSIPLLVPVLLCIKLCNNALGW